MNRTEIMAKLNEIFCDVFDDEDIVLSDDTTADDISTCWLLSKNSSTSNFSWQMLLTWKMLAQWLTWLKNLSVNKN